MTAVAQKILHRVASFPPVIKTNQMKPKVLKRVTSFPVSLLTNKDSFKFWPGFFQEEIKSASNLAVEDRVSETKKGAIQLSCAAAYRAKTRLGNISPDNHPSKFSKLYFEEGGAVFLDFDPLLKYGNHPTAEVISPKILDQRIVFDHHGRFRNHPQNTTQQIITILRRMKHDPSFVVEMFTQIMPGAGIICTDNMADGLLGMWVLNHAGFLMDHPELMNAIYKATDYEDFKIFGYKYEAQVRAKHAESPENIAWIQALNEMGAIQAIMFKYEKLMIRYHLKDTDRICELPCMNQQEIVNLAMSFVDRIMHRLCFSLYGNNNTAQGEIVQFEGMQDFNTLRNQAAHAVLNSNEVCLHRSVTEAALTVSELTHVEELFFLWDQTKIATMDHPSHRFFSKNTGAYLAEYTRIHAKFTEFLLPGVDGGKKMMKFVISYPNSAGINDTEMPDLPSLKVLENALKEAHLKNMAEDYCALVEEGKMTEEEMNKALQVEELTVVFALIARSDLVASFKGLRLEFTDFVKILASFQPPQRKLTSQRRHRSLLSLLAAEQSKAAAAAIATAVPSAGSSSRRGSGETDFGNEEGEDDLILEAEVIF